MTDSEEWTQVGEVGIDSGTLALVDPAYAGAAEAALESMGADEVGQIRPPGAPRDLGVIVGTGFGDGIYPVEVRYQDFEGVANPRRIVEVRVRFA